ncbi:MAG: flagellar basal body rod protein FlgC [Alphaproteobacteria bacterium]|nr:flagellar basal body rod protein FlgC [Alphaproteobacteria bacterium]
MDLKSSMNIAAAGMKAQGARIRIVSENLANSESTSQTPGGEPYRRKLVSFSNVLDSKLGYSTVKVSKVSPDPSDFQLKFDPHHPAANSEGYVLQPNVNNLVEVADMREATRSYEANLNVVDMSRTMLQRTIDILKS